MEIDVIRSFHTILAHSMGWLFHGWRMWYKPGAEHEVDAADGLAASQCAEQETVMDDRQTSLEAADSGLQGPHRFCPDVLPLDFVPLRLLLQPGGLRIELTRPDMLVGRHSDADIRLTLADVSRRHCRFTFRDGHWKV